jgi:flagellar motor switch protein FliG
MAKVNTQKVAALLLSLGVERSSQVLQYLGEEEMERVMIALSQVDSVAPETRREALSEAYSLSVENAGKLNGGIEYTRQLLAKTLGPHRGTKILERISARQKITSFDILHEADPAQIAGMLMEEHPQAIALVISYLDAKMAAQILTHMSRELQVDVTLRLAQMDRVAPQVVQLIEKGLKQKISGVISAVDYKTTGGVTFLVRVLNQVDRGVQKSIFETLESSDPKLVDEIRSNMFTFDDLIKLDDRSMQKVLGQVNKQDLALALKGAPEKLQEHIFKNLSERTRDSLKEDLEMLGPQLARNVYTAQRKVVDVVRAMEESEEILIGGVDSDDEIIP